MKSFGYILLVVLTSGILSCSKEEPGFQGPVGKLNVNIRLMYGDEPLIMLKKYKLADNRDILFNRVSMLISNIKLGELEVNKDDVKMLNFTNQNSSLTNAIQGVTLEINNAPAINNSNLSFCIGLPSELNQKDPSKYGINSPLSDQGEFWSAWKSFIFARFEGFYDGKKTGQTDKSFLLHTGGDDALRCLNLKQSIFITENQTKTITLLLDMKTILAGYDIDANPDIQDLSQAPFVKQISDNIGQAFRLL